MERLFLMFLDHAQRRSTVGRTPLDEWSARRRDFYLTTHDTHNRQISMPPVGFEPTISAGERPILTVLLWQVVKTSTIIFNNPAYCNNYTITIYIYVQIYGSAPTCFGHFQGGNRHRKLYWSFWNVYVVTCLTARNMDNFKLYFYIQKIHISVLRPWPKAPVVFVNPSRQRRE